MTWHWHMQGHDARKGWMDFPNNRHENFDDAFDAMEAARKTLIEAKLKPVIPLRVIACDCVSPNVESKDGSTDKKV